MKEIMIEGGYLLTSDGKLYRDSTKRKEIKPIRDVANNRLIFRLRGHSKQTVTAKTLFSEHFFDDYDCRRHITEQVNGDLYDFSLSNLRVKKKSSISEEKQLLIVEMLEKGYSVNHVAKAVEVAYRTVKRYRDNRAE